MSGPISEARGRVKNEDVKNGRSERDYLWYYWVNRIASFCEEKELPDCKDRKKPYTGYDALEELRGHLYALELYWNDKDPIFEEAAGLRLNRNSFLATIPAGADVDATMKARLALAEADITKAYNTLLAYYGGGINVNRWSQSEHNILRYTALYNGGLAELCNQLVQNIYAKYAYALQRQKDDKGIPTAASAAAEAAAAEAKAQYHESPIYKNYQEDLRKWNEEKRSHEMYAKKWPAGAPPQRPLRPRPRLPPMPGQAVQNLGVQGGGRTRRRGHRTRRRMKRTRKGKVAKCVPLTKNRKHTRV